MGSGALLLIFCLGLVCFQDVMSQKCTSAPPKLPGQSLPNLQEIAGDAYAFFVEGNLPAENTTYYITEYLDLKNRRSRLNVKRFGQDADIFYFEKTNEMFLVTGETCINPNMTVLQMQIQEFVDVNEEDLVLDGMSSLLKAAYRDWKVDGLISVEPDYVFVRGLKCSVWTWCTSRGHTIKLYFTDPRTVNLYGLDNIPIPVRITIRTESGSEEHLEFFRMIPKMSSKQMDEIMTLPAKKGCRRSEDSRDAPSFATKNVYLEAEIIYKPFRKNLKGYTYVTNLKYLRHRASQLTAVHWTPWTTNSENGMSLPGNHTFRVFDDKYGFTYTMDMNTEECQMTMDDGFSFPLPDGTNLDDMKEDLLFFGDDAPSYHFLGQTMERGIPAAVFEKNEEDVVESRQRLITRYYMDDDTLLDDDFQERNSPLKTILLNTDDLNTDEMEFMGELTINVYGFKTHFGNVHEMFDVSACFPEEDQSKWFQLVFPLGDNRLSDIMPHLPHIRNDLPPLLQAFDKDHSPLRIPRIQVDYDPRHIYATGLILERPDFLLDFSSVTNRALKLNPAKTQAKVSTLKECAKSCLENPFCQYFSYCGAVCIFATDNELSLTADMENKADCTLYNNTLYKEETSTSNSLWTMDQLSSYIKLAVETGSLKMTYFKPDGNPLDLVADQLKDNIAFGRNGMTQRRETNPANWFSVYNDGFALNSKALQGSRTLNKVSFEKCKSTCASVPWCESVSYCLASRECVLTDMYREQIKKEKMAPNTQCMILSRNYMDRYRAFNGTVIVTQGEKTSSIATVEECAQACFKETSFTCLSFDFCFYDEMKCLMHKKHFDTGTPTETQQLGKAEECTHYSRKVIHDFNQFRDTDMSRNVAGLRLANVTAEDCARICREERYVQPCAGFDHCSSGLLGANSTCVLRKASKPDPQASKDGSTCNSYVWKS